MTDARALRTHGLGFVTLLAMAGGFYALGMAPSAELRSAEASRQRELVRLAAELDEKSGKLAGLRTDVARVRTAAQAEQIELTPVTMLTSRLALIAAEAERSGLVVDELHPSKPETSGLFERVTITMSGSGRWGQVAGFLGRVNEQLRDTAVIGLEIDSGARAGDPARFAVTLRWFAEPAGGPATADAR